MANETVDVVYVPPPPPLEKGYWADWNGMEWVIKVANFDGHTPDNPDNPPNPILKEIEDIQTRLAALERNAISK